LGIGVGHTLADGLGDRRVDCLVGEFRQVRSNLFERQLARKVPKRDRQSKTPAALAKRSFKIPRTSRERDLDSSSCAIGKECRRDILARLQSLAKERRVLPRARNGLLSKRAGAVRRHWRIFTIFRRNDRKLPRPLGRLQG
jgi:hypothetical protein